MVRDVTLDDLKTKYPTWNIRHSAGCFIATRMDRDLFDEDLEAGFHATLTADRIDDLERLLAAQFELDKARLRRLQEGRG
ncbi:hypothetical protein GCM10022221_57260 [Actinocorallia aurea]